VGGSIVMVKVTIQPVCTVGFLRERFYLIMIDVESNRCVSFYSPLNSRAIFA
jgi:hypothetical protein